jgi:hypothetical protein
MFGSAYLRKPARALCNGKTLAFQAKDAGSIPAARSSLPDQQTDAAPRVALKAVSLISMPCPSAFRIG